MNIMHAVLEGVETLEVKLVLQRSLYEDILFKLEQLNDKILSFDYDCMNERNKPSVIQQIKTLSN